MRGLLPSVWLLLAGLYTASLIALIQPFSFGDDWPRRRPAMRRCARRSPGTRPCRLPPKPPLHPCSAFRSLQRSPRRVWSGRTNGPGLAGYTTVARAEPTTIAPVLFAYTPGRPLRVIAREGGFAHVQDLGSGQYGWVKESALAPFTGGDRQREDVAPQPQVVASAAPASVPEQVAAPPAVAPQAVAPPAPAAKAVVVAARKLRPPRSDAAAARPDKETVVAAAEPEQRGLFGFRRNRPQRIALSGNDSGFAGIINRAFGSR